MLVIFVSNIEYSDTCNSLPNFRVFFEDLNNAKILRYSRLQENAKITNKRKIGSELRVSERLTFDAKNTSTHLVGRFRENFNLRLIGILQL